MPETQIFVEVAKQRSAATDELRNLQQQLAVKRNEMIQVANKLRSHERLIRDIDRFVEGRGNRNPLENGAEAAVVEDGDENTGRRQFIMACPMENCRGFLSSGWKCGVCDARICKDCHERKEDADDTNPDAMKVDHVCDENIKASVALMKHDSRPCPSCASMIFKIHGCDQMWCTQCATAFSMEYR